MKKIMMFMVLVLGVTMFTGCHKDADDEGDLVPGNAYYDLILENDTDEEIEIYLQGLTSEDFERRGLVGPGEEMIIQLTVEFTYVIRATAPGAPLDDYFFQESVTRTSPTDMTLVIRE